MCQITSQPIRDQYAVELDEADFASGGLHRKSNVRPNRLFTADSGIILYRAGSLKPNKSEEVIAKVVEILES